MLIDKLREDKQKATLAKDEMRKLTLSIAIAEIERKPKTISEEEQVAVCFNLVSTWNETIGLCAHRTSEKTQYEAQVEILKAYLPPRLTIDEIMDLIQTTILTLIESDMPVNKGSVMKLITTKTKGKADGKLVSQLVDDSLRVQ